LVKDLVVLVLVRIVFCNFIVPVNEMGNISLFKKKYQHGKWQKHVHHLHSEATLPFEVHAGGRTDEVCQPFLIAHVTSRWVPTLTV
jgi:hypothetical protein